MTESNVFVPFTAKAVQLNGMSVGAGLLMMMVNPFTLLLATRYCTLLLNMLLSASMTAAVFDESLMLMDAFTIGWSRYGWSKVTSTDVAP